MSPSTVRFSDAVAAPYAVAPEFSGNPPAERRRRKLRQPGRLTPRARGRDRDAALGAANPDVEVTNPFEALTPWRRESEHSLAEGRDVRHTLPFFEGAT